MEIKEKKICPGCNYLGTKEDNICPYCGIKLISKCPKCGARIKSAFSEYCYICGLRFADAIHGNPHSNQPLSTHYAKQNKKGGGDKKKKRKYGDTETMIKKGYKG